MHRRSNAAGRFAAGCQEPAREARSLRRPPSGLRVRLGGGPTGPRRGSAASRSAIPSAGIAALAHDVDAGALLCGGDLYEHDRVTPDTARFLQTTFADLDPRPVYLAPGNHDWYGPDSVYALVDWSSNVHIFREPRLRPVALGDDLTLWGAAHCAPANTGNFFEGFAPDGPGMHVALCHAAERTGLAAQGSGKQPHAPFDARDIERAGLAHALPRPLPPAAGRGTPHVSRKPGSPGVRRGERARRGGGHPRRRTAR